MSVQGAVVRHDCHTLQLMPEAAAAVFWHFPFLFEARQKLFEVSDRVLEQLLLLCTQYSPPFFFLGIRLGVKAGTSFGRSHVCALLFIGTVSNSVNWAWLDTKA